MIGYARAQLQQQARKGFEDSDRLFREAINHAGGGNTLTSRYLTAAQAYARALEVIAGWAQPSSGGPGSHSGLGGSGPATR